MLMFDKYSGVSPLDDNRKMVSTHCEYPDNPRAVNALLKKLRSMGYVAYTHPFYYTPPDNEVPIKLQNVIADLPGTGRTKLDPDPSDKVRQIFLEYPEPNISSNSFINDGLE